MSAKSQAQPTVLLYANTNPQMQMPLSRLDESGAAVQTGGHVSVPAPHLDQSETRVEFWDGVHDPDQVELTLSTDNDRQLALVASSLGDEHRRYAVAVHELGQIVDAHSAGVKPAWISCTEPGLEAAACKFFGCPAGQPVALLTNVGRDALHAQHLSTSAQPASFNYMALTATTTAPNATDTTLAGEIATASGGLIRKQATYAHTTGTNTTTLTATFTANGNDVLPVTIAQDGIFNAASVGTLSYHDALSSSATLSAIGDSLTNTHTLNIG